ncbi:hypothetical protein CALCODRAFT_360460 [Calocera cornea HHB12733]|uniref:Uncharacterized protein n=1 Tax=Calocera cornea HHB12733 TaxID=1353952 RepID=A0A165EMN3_9BASI|nr:hypothetical protein CALCODRAFT_360460 [Calocera cornea HHB12733]
MLQIALSVVCHCVNVFRRSKQGRRRVCVGSKDAARHARDACLFTSTLVRPLLASDDKMGHHVIPQDIWRTIFEVIVDEEQSSHVALSLMHVCKEWKAIAQPLLYRHLRFQKLISLEQYKDALVQHAIQCHYPGSATHSLTVSIWDDEQDHSREHIHTILQFNPHLRHFNFICHGLTSNMLTDLQRVGCQSLTDLHIRMSPNGLDTALHLAMLGRFAMLRHLFIMLEESGPTENASLSNAPVLDMPALATLELTRTSDVPLSNLVRHLSHGHFPSLTALTLDLTVMEVADNIASPSVPLLPLFQNIGPQLLSLEFSAEEARDAPRVLFPLLNKLRHLRIWMYGFDDGLGQFLPASLVKLECEVELDNALHTQSLLQCLDDVLSRPEGGLKIDVIHVHSLVYDEFSWASIGDINPDLAGLLLARSIRLLERGIRLEDEDGKCLGTLI